MFMNIVFNHFTSIIAWVYQRFIQAVLINYWNTYGNYNCDLYRLLITYH